MKQTLFSEQNLTTGMQVHPDVTGVRWDAKCHAYHADMHLREIAAVRCTYALTDMACQHAELGKK